MKVKIHLKENETLEDAEEFLEKSLAAKKDCSHSEKYTSEYLNEFHDHICSEFENLINDVLEEVKQEIKQHANSKEHL